MIYDCCFCGKCPQLFISVLSTWQKKFPSKLHFTCQVNVLHTLKARSEHFCTHTNVEKLKLPIPVFITHEKYVLKCTHILGIISFQQHELVGSSRWFYVLLQDSTISEDWTVVNSLLWKSVPAASRWADEIVYKICLLVHTREKVIILRCFAYYLLQLPSKEGNWKVYDYATSVFLAFQVIFYESCTSTSICT